MPGCEEGTWVGSFCKMKILIPARPITWKKKQEMWRSFLASNTFFPVFVSRNLSMSILVLWDKVSFSKDFIYRCRISLYTTPRALSGHAGCYWKALGFQTFSSNGTSACFILNCGQWFMFLDMSVNYTNSCWSVVPKVQGWTSLYSVRFIWNVFNCST